MLFDSPVPFRDALESRAVRTVLPTDFRTALLDTIAPELRERSMFSAGVTEAETLQQFDDLIGQLLRGETDQATARTTAKSYLGSLGAEVNESDLTDIHSDARLNLILETNVAQAQGYGGWAQGQDEAILDQWPAQELYRAIQSRVPRNWEQRWTDAGGQLFGIRMIALKDDPIWIAISRFGTPYPPFDFNSGMDVRDVTRDEAMRLGLIDRDTRIPPQTRGFAEDLAATPEVRASGLMRALEAQFAGRAAFDADGVFRLVDALRSSASFDPSQARAEDGRWTDGGGNPIGSRPRDFLGKKPARGEEPYLPDNDNIDRGRRSVEHLLNRQSGSVRDAMFHRELGQVEIPWGRPGDPSPKTPGKAPYWDGYGVSHIREKHGDQALAALPEVLAKGQVLPHPDPAKRYVVLGKWQAVVGKTSPHSAWAITNFDPREKK